MRRAGVTTPGLPSSEHTYADLQFANGPLQWRAFGPTTLSPRLNREPHTSTPGRTPR